MLMPVAASGGSGRPVPDTAWRRRGWPRPKPSRLPRVTAVAGVATFAGCNIDKAGTGYTLTSMDNTTALTPGVSSPATTINVGAAAKLAFTIQPDGSATGGVAFPTQPQVTIEDAGGNLTGTGTTSITLAIGTNGGGGTLSCTTNPKRATAGVDTFGGCAITLAGNGYTLTAAAGGLTGATSTPFNVSVGPESKLVFTPQPPATTQAGSTMATFAVSVEDAGGDVVTTSTDSITMAISTNPAPGTGVLSGTTTVSAINGVASFVGLSIDKANTGYRLTPTDNTTTLTATASNTFNITAGTATQLAFTTEPSATATPGTNFTTQPTVTVQDANGNTILTGTGSTASITLVLGGVGGGSLTCTANPRAAVGGVERHSPPARSALRAAIPSRPMPAA